MSGDIEVFRFEGIEINVTREGDSFRVEAPGLARALGYREAYDLVQSIPGDEKGSAVTRTPGGDQRIWYLTEPGFYRALAKRRPSLVRDETTRAVVIRFQRFVFHELLPKVMRGKAIGRPSAMPTSAGVLQIDLSMATRKQIALWVIQQEDEIERLEAERDHLEPFARAWDELAEGQDHEVADAAKIVSRMHGVEVGQRVLFAEMRELRWVFRGRGDGKWRPYQRAIKRGLLAEAAGRGAPQVRVTNKGLRELHSHFAKQGRLRLVPALPEGRELEAGSDA
ncbi:MAG TPA: phage antirepressor KilAC domain-containing protein [Propionibacteriaceae bacterium]|nr:phage antirepressor KilAC domain-containing protein [Propionibacteriaceae bacterium]